MAAVMPCDPEESLRWQTDLAPEHYNIPLHSLRDTTCSKLADHLNDEKQYTNGMPADYRGLAEIIGFNPIDIVSFGRAPNPAEQLLDVWKRHSDLQPTVGNLARYLSLLGREDVLEDCHGMLRSDAQFFLDNSQDPIQDGTGSEAQFSLDNKSRPNSQDPIQDGTVSPGPGIVESPLILTLEDAEAGKPTRYTAFVCYNEERSDDSSEDFNFVRQLLHRFENPPYDFKLYVTDRNLLPGLSTLSSNATIIAERCDHVIVVLSPNFLQCETCKFYAEYAQSLSDGARNRRLIPVMIKECQIPPIFCLRKCCDFTREDPWDNVWDRLARSLQAPLQREDSQVSQTSDGPGPQMTRDMSSGQVNRSVSVSSSSSSLGSSNRQRPCDSGIDSDTENIAFGQAESTSACGSVGSSFSRYFKAQLSQPESSSTIDQESETDPSSSYRVQTNPSGVQGTSAGAIPKRFLKKITDTFSGKKQ